MEKAFRYFGNFIATSALAALTILICIADGIPEEKFLTWVFACLLSCIGVAFGIWVRTWK